MTPGRFVAAIARVSLNGVFNPYADICPYHDRIESPAQRKRNLLLYLEAALGMGLDTVWMGRDLGYKGGRRTGLPLTDEGHLDAFKDRYPGCKPVKATTTAAVMERTATEIWSKLGTVKQAPFLWNVFPFHPYVDGRSMTNRRYKSSELAVAHKLNIALMEMLGIVRVVAIGRDAQEYASRLGIAVESVRHPSYGGTKDFRSSIYRIYPEAQSARQHTLALAKCSPPPVS